MDTESPGNSTDTVPLDTEEGLKHLIIKINEKLESLRGQYENQLDSLRTEIDRSRQRRSSKEDDGTSGAGQPEKQQTQLGQLKKDFGSSLTSDQKEQLEKLMSNIDQEYQCQLEDMQRQHVDDVDVQVKAMRVTLEEIYNSQLVIARSEMKQSHEAAMLDLRENLEKDSKEEINRLEQEWSTKLEDLKQDYEQELRESKLGDSISKEESDAFITKLNRKLTEEHKQIIQKIEADLEKSQLAIRHHTQDSQTEGDDSVSVASVPVTKAEFKHLEEKHSVISKAEEAQKALEAQLEEINALRATMLGEYEQMLSVRAEVMSSQSEEVEKLQQEMAQIQQQYENQMAEFQHKVQAQTEATLKASHEKELEEMKQYYETKVSEMEETYTTDIAQLKQEHAELIARLQQESTSGVDIPSLQELGADKHREYVHRTTMLTAISDEEETSDSTPPSGTQVLKGRIKLLEEKLKEKEKLVEQLKHRLEAETTSAEDLHGKLLDSNKTLEDFEENLKTKAQEIEELKKELTNRDKRISDLESEKAALEEKGEKDKSLTEDGDGKLVQELKDRIKKLEEELSASKATNARIQEEMNQLDAQHGEAIMKLKDEMKALNKSRIEELESGFQIQLEEELKQQAEELDNRYREELDRQNEELEAYKKTESELKQKLDSIQTEHEKQLSELREKYEVEAVEEPRIEVREVMEVQLTSPSETVDRDSLEAAIRENVRAEILQEYEASIDRLKSEYEERISDLNERLQSFETQGVEKAEVSDQGLELSDSQELELKERLRAELALEFKEKLQSVTDEYESKLKTLQDIVDSKKEVKSPNAPYALARSRSLDMLPSREKEKPKPASDYEGYVTTIRHEYEDKINSLQMQIAQYRSTVGSVPSSPSRKPHTEQVLVGDSAAETVRKPMRDSGLEISIRTELGTPELRQEIHDEIAKEFEASFRNLRANYEKQIAELNSRIEELEATAENSLENKIREEVKKEYEAKLTKLKEEYEQQISDLNAEHETKVEKLNEDIEKAKAEKLAAEKKVKADMFVWHEEMMREQKNKHEKYESQLRKEYEEKMELYREELQENFDAEKERMIREHKQELVDMEDRYENLLEGLRTGEMPEVAQLVQQKFDMELEMAKTLIQQECDETIEAEQARLNEQFEKQLQEVIEERERELKEQGEQYQREMEELRSSLLQQYQSQLIEQESKHRAAMTRLRAEYESLVLGSQQIHAEAQAEIAKQDTIVKETVKRLKTQPSEESVKTEEGDKEEETEETTSLDSTSGKSDKDDDSDDKGGGKGGAVSGTDTTPSADTGDKHEQEKATKDEEAEGKDETDVGGTEVVETFEKVTVQTAHTGRPGTTSWRDQPDSNLVQQLRQELEHKEVEYEATIAALKSSHAEEVEELKAEITQLQLEYEQKVTALEESHEDAISKLAQDDTEALDIAHQQELQDLEDRLVEKHMNELNNLETQHQSRMDELRDKYESQIEQLHEELTVARRALEQYPEVTSPEQTVPTFRLDSTMGSTKETEDFMARTTTPRSQSDSDKSESQTGPKTETMETQQFEAHSVEERSAVDSQGEDDGSLKGTLEEVGIQSLDETSIEQSRGTLRGVDTTQDTELIEFSEEEEGSDKSMEEGTETQKSDRSTPTALMQTLGYGAEIPGGPTVKSLDDTTDSSIRASDREELVLRVKELEAEVEELRHRLKTQLSKQDEQMERLDREKSEESNLAGMLRGDIERLNSDRDALQTTNEQLLNLLSEAVKTYMGVEESITKKMKVMMEKTEVKGHPGSGERKRTPPPGKKPSPATSPSRLSPARAEDGETQDTSIVSNVTDEGLDLSQRISDSIFQGPELTSEEEELLIDSGSRLHSSVTHLLEMMEETTNQLVETRQTQVQMIETLEGKSHELELLTTRCSELEERLKEEVGHKDFLVLELHKAEGLIEGYSSERESLDQRIQDLEEHKETLVLELETTRNKLLALESIKEEHDRLRREMDEQQELLSGNVGEQVQALMLEVTRLNSENREKDEQIKQVHDRFESRVRELESSGEDMETHFSKLVDDKKQEVADLKLQVEALEKQLKAKKQFIEEQSVEREQEHEEYQKELEKWKKIVQELEKQNGAGSRLQREIDDLTEQLQTRIDQHNQALLEAERYQHESQDKELSINELKTIIQQLEQDLQDQTQELESATQKLMKLEEELSRRPELDEDLSDSMKSDVQSPKPGSSLEFDASGELKRERSVPQMTVEEEMRQAENKTKEELVREKFTLQTQVNEYLVQISSLRNQLDEMRHRRGIGDVPETVRTLELEREKSEEKDKQIAELKLQMEQLAETIENRDQQIEQLREQRERGRMGRGSPVEGIEFESDREIEKQIEALKRENKQLRERVKLSEASSVTDMSGLSQNLLEEKNQEIDHLSEQILRLQSDFSDLKAEKGIQNLASIQQEMQDSVARNLEKMSSLESEVTALKAALHNKEEQLVALDTELSTLREDLQGKDEMILALQTEPIQEKELLEGLPEDPSLLQAMIQEKEDLITQLTVQVDSLQTEMYNLSDFQNKLQEDFDTVQAMLEEKDKEIESLTKELTDRSPTQTDEHSLVIKHEVEIARLKKELREKDNVVEEKLEEIAEVDDKVELLESHIAKYKEQVKSYDEQVLALERELKRTKKQLDAAIQQSPAALTADEKDEIIKEKTVEIERLNREIETAALGRPPSPPLSQDKKSQVIKEQKEEIESLKKQIQKLLGKPPSPPSPNIEKSREIKKLKEQIVNLTAQLEAASLGSPPLPPGEGEEASTDVVVRLRSEIEKLKQQILDANLTEDDKFILIRDLRLENETLRKQIDAALKIRPPSPPLDEDEKSELIREQKKEIQKLKDEIETTSKFHTVLSKSESEKDEVIIKQEKEIKKLRKQVEEALKIPPPLPPMSDDEKDRKLEEKETEVFRLTTELTKVTEALKDGEGQKLIKEKIDESLKLKSELDEVKHKLESLSTSSIQSVIIEQKDKEIEMKDKEIRKAKASIQKLEEELNSVKEVRAYEDEIELKEKQDEIEELQAELEKYRSRTSSMLEQSVDLETSLTSERRDSADLVKSLSFYKEQYEEKCSESRQLQVQLDLVKDQLEKARRARLGDAQEEIEIFKAELERKTESKAKTIQTEKETFENENREMKRQLAMVKEQLHQTADERFRSMEAELELTKDELAKERKDNVQTINDMEKLRERKEKERRDSLKTIQDLEHDLEEKVAKEKQLNTQIKQLSEELTLIKRQYGIEDKSVGSESRTSPKSLELRSQGSFELGTDVDTLQQQVMQFKQQADKAREVLSDKQKYQSQVVKLEIQLEQLQKQMKKEVGQLEEQLKSYAKQPDYDVWTQLHATQDRLEETTRKLQETSERLSETDTSLQRVSTELTSREGDMRDLQQELWKTSGQLSVTSGRLQETEEKLRQTLAQVSEREDQIHQLQVELQEAEKVSKKAKESPDIKPGELDKLRKQLKSSQEEIEALKKSLTEAVEMSEQQLQMVENKDQEYVKLKLDIQQTLAEKEKVIKDQKNKIKEKEQEVKGKEKELMKVRQEVEQLNAAVKRKESAESEVAALRAQLEKVMNLKDELANEHQRHIQEMSQRAHQDTETQLATMRIKYTDEIEHLKKLHAKELEEKLHDLKQKLERKHKSETNKLTVKHQEEMGALKLRAGVDLDDSSVYDRQQRQRQEGVGADRSVVNGHAEPMSQKLQDILRRLHSEGVQVLTISELEFLNRSQAQSLPPEADVESMKAGWENERQSMLSTIQSLKDLLAQTHKVRGLDKSLDSSDWRAELLRAIGYVFTKERESLLAELRSHVLSYPSTNLDETQRLEQKIRNLEAHHHAALEQIFSADRQSMLAEIRDLRAHATIARMHQQEERERMNVKIANTEDTSLKKERQLKREELPEEPEPIDFISAGVQLLEFKIQQEKVLHEDLRTSLDSERNRSGELSGLLNQEKTHSLDLQTTISALQIQVAKLREGLEREQSRYVSVTLMWNSLVNALEEEKSKSLNLSDLLESERDTLWRVQAELEALKQQQAYTDPRAIEQLQKELNAERERRCHVDSQHEIDVITMENLKQEVEMGKRHHQATEAELGARVSQLQRMLDLERQKQGEITRALERERSLSAHLQQSLEAEKSNSEKASHLDQSTLQDLQIQLETEHANLDDLNRALQREQRARDEAESEKSLLKDHLNQERALNENLKRDLDKLQFERLEAVNKLQKERDMVARLKSERDQLNEDLKKVKSLEIQRDQNREAERLASRKSVKEAEREKEEYRMKLHEQELETQRLSQKVQGLGDQLAECQENELKAIRELEKLKLDNMQPSEQPEMLSVQTSPRPDVTDGMSYEQRNGHLENCSVYRSQLESMCQSLHYLILRCREQLSKASHSGGRPVSMADFDDLQRSLRDLLGEVKQLQELEGDYMTHPSGSVNERILRQNEELTNFVARISEEKTELRNMLTRLEEEIWRYRQMDAKYQEMQRMSSGSDARLISERSEWAKEKLSLQMALNSAEREIDLLQTDLRVERERRVASGITDTKDTDKIKIQRLYGKYLRAESFRKALIYQKKYLLLLLGGFQDTEETTLVLLSRMGAVDSSHGRRRRSKPLTAFRGAVRVIIAIQRMKFLVKKWRRATRVGSDVVGGSLDQTNGYVPQANGYSPPRTGTSPRASSIPVRSSSSPPAWTSSRRQPSPSRSADNSTFFSPRYDVDSYSSSPYTSPRVTTTSFVPFTPPTKDYSSATRYTSPSSGARRKILTTTSIPAHRSGGVRFTLEDNKPDSLGETDDYINRLENLQSRLGTLQTGKRSSTRQAWR